MIDCFHFNIFPSSFGLKKIPLTRRKVSALEVWNIPVLNGFPMQGVNALKVLKHAKRMLQGLEKNVRPIKKGLTVPVGNGFQYTV
jgi:hypothetical protein